MDPVNPERPAAPAAAYPLEFDVEYPDRPLNRVSTALRIFWVIPIAIVLGLVSHTSFSVSAGDEYAGFVSAGGLLIAAPLVMILFREKYRAGGSTGTASCSASRTASTRTGRS